MTVQGDTVYEYGTRYGTLYVRIKPAVTRDDWVAEKGCIRRNHPVVLVTSSPSGEWSGSPEYLKVRGRRYSTFVEYERMPDDWIQAETARGYTPAPWGELHFMRRRDTGAEVERLSGTFKALREAEMEALGRFHAEHPEWERESVRLLMVRDLADLRADVEEKRNMLAVAERKLAAYETALAQFDSQS